MKVRNATHIRMIANITALAEELDEDGFEMSLESSAAGDDGTLERTAHELLLSTCAYAASALLGAAAALDLVDSAVTLDSLASGEVV